jgi:hypothetical protein
MSLLDLSHIANSLPYPLGLKLHVIRAEARARSEGSAAPNLPFTIVAFNGLCLRLATLVAVQAYVKAGAGDNAVNQALVDQLRQPTDGTWRELLGKLVPTIAGDVHGARVERWVKAPASVPPAGQGWETPGFAISDQVADVFRSPSGKGRPALPKAGSASGTKDNVDGAMGDIVTFRNKLVHGTAPTDEAIDLALLRIEAIARACHAAFRGASLEVREGDRGWRVMGHVPIPLETVSDALENGIPMLCFDDGTPPLSLAPLLRFRPGDNPEVDIDELFFVNAAALEKLHYVGFRAGAQADGRALGTYEAFKAFWQRIPVTPTPRDPVLVYDELAAYHGSLFVGRGEVLEELEGGLANAGEPGRYLELRALAGMGKTALLASLYARQRNQAQETANEAERPLPGAWAFHFCAQTEGREYALVALRSVAAQLCVQANLKREHWLSNDLKELREQRLPELLYQASKVKGRCVVVLDALDESTGSDDDALAACLPDFLPEGVTFVISWRVDPTNKASRVDRQLAHIPAARKVALTTANPLAGLARVHVDAFLDKVAGHPVPVATLDAVWDAATRSSRGADPFFLRFVAEAVREGRVDLERAETVPASLDDAFEGQWLSLPVDHGFLSQRMLLLLGILREYGDDALLAELIGLDPQYQSASAGEVPRAEDIARMRQHLGKLLVYDGERYGLFHDRFRRFLVGPQKDPIAEALGEA